MTGEVRFSNFAMTDVFDDRCCFATDLSSEEAAARSRCQNRATVHLLMDPYADESSTLTCDEHFHAASALAIDNHPVELVCLPPYTFWVAPWPEKGITSHCALDPIETEPTT